MSKRRAIKKLAIISESASVHFGVIEPQQLPSFRGHGKFDFLCGYCECVLGEKLDRIPVVGALRCPKCHCINDLGQMWNIKSRPILFKDLLELPFPTPTCSISSLYIESEYKKELDKLSDKALTKLYATQNRLPVVLRHYTSSKGLMGIIETGKIWATDIKYLNDSSEYIHASNLINNILTEKQKSLTPIGKELLSRSKVLEDLDSSSYSYFVTCFCSNKDLLSQWRGYGGAEGSFSIGLSTAYIANIQNIELRKLIYDSETKNNLVSNFIDEVCCLFEAKYKNQSIRELDQSRALPRFASFINSHLIEFLLTFKHEAFKEENEYRIIFPYNVNEHKKMLQFRYSKDKLIPYVEIELNKFKKDYPLIPLIEITCGPSMNGELASKSLHQYLSKHNYHHVEVALSDIPYRG